MEAIFAGSPLALRAYDAYADVVEGEASFHDNALLKARTLYQQLKRARIDAAVLADDSGLEVSALRGRPGVLSARYAGADATWAQRRSSLLAEMRDVPEALRAARFVCVMALVLPSGEMLAGEGTIEGRIASEECGARGFGYDAIFIPRGEPRSFAQMDEIEKNAISHRRRAAEALLATLRR